MNRQRQVITVVVLGTLIALGCAPARAVQVPTDRIAFSSNRSGTAQIYVVNADSTGLNRLTFSAPAFQDTQPAWSPDGTKIAFSRAPVPFYDSVNMAHSEIWVMDADGTDAEVLIREPGQLADRPQWSPDGTKIAYTRGSPVQIPYDIWVFDLTTRTRKALTTSGDAAYPAWSPDGRALVFLRQQHIWRMDAEGRDQVRLTQTGPNFVPNWAPGSDITFTSARDGGAKQVYVMRSDGSGARRVFASTGEQKLPAFSPDGTRLVFGQGRGPCQTDVDLARCQVDNDYELVSVNTDGSHLVTLTDVWGPRPQFGESYPAYAPRRLPS